MRFIPELTSDGSYTFFSPEFEETFHSRQGAREEAQEKFIIPCGLAKTAQQQSHLTIVDICYGLGYNTATALETIWRSNPNCQVTVIALEFDERVPQAAIHHNLLQGWSSPIPEFLTTLAQHHQIHEAPLNAKLLIGDARQTIQQLIQQGVMADAMFLDPFSPPHCPQLWTVEFLALVSQCLHSQGQLATYSCAAAVRTALHLSGLHYTSTMGMNRRSTVASWQSASLPLSQLELEHQQTRAAIPYRDPSLQDSSPTILQRRRQEQQTSNLESTSQWRRRWVDQT